jgi:hypothetical protein
MARKLLEKCIRIKFRGTNMGHDNSVKYLNAKMQRNSSQELKEERLSEGKRDLPVENVSKKL